MLVAERSGTTITVAVKAAGTRRNGIGGKQTVDILSLEDALAFRKELDAAVRELADERKAQIQAELARLQQELAGLSDIKAEVKEAAVVIAAPKVADQEKIARIVQEQIMQNRPAGDEDEIIL